MERWSYTLVNFSLNFIVDCIYKNENSILLYGC